MLLEGKKTYIIGIALIMWAVGGAIAGKVDWNTAVAELLAALGLIGLRIGIKSSKDNKQDKIENE